MGRTLRDLREARGYTQGSLAEQLGVSRQTVNNWENGGWSIALGRISRVARALKVSPGHILTALAQTEAEFAHRVTDGQAKAHSP